MKLPKYLHLAIFGFLLSNFVTGAFAITSSPSSLSVAVGESKTVVISKNIGAFSVKNSNSKVVAVTLVGVNTYNFKGMAAGKAEIEFKDKKSKTKVKATVSPVVAQVLNGRLLASNCFQCHGTNGTGGFDRLSGKSANETYKDLKEFASGQEDPNSIMAAHAMGFTDAQLRAMAVYFSSLK
jgi:cytochrome c553